MLYSQLRHTIASFARGACFGFVTTLALAFLTTPGKEIVNRIGDSYIDILDTMAASDAEESNWTAFEALGEISRHHRYAEFKSQVWSQTLHRQDKLDKSYTRWANKNQRNIKMQLELADYYAAQGKQEKSFKLLRRLYAKVPDHPGLAKAYHQAAAKIGRKVPQSTMNAAVQEYLAQ